MKYSVLLVFFTAVILGCQQVSIDEMEELIDAKVKQHLAELPIEQNINQQIRDLNLEEWQTGVDQGFQENISRQMNAGS